MAAYTHLSEETLREVLSWYGLEFISSRFIGGLANTNYDLLTTGGRFVLNILDSHEADSIRLLGPLMLRLVGRGLPVPRPAVSYSGKTLLEVQGKPMMLKHYIEGRVDVVLPAAMLTEAGSILAAVHDVTPLNGMRFWGRRLPGDARSRANEFSDKLFGAWVNDQLDAVIYVLKNDVPFGLVHGDLFAGDVVIRPDGHLSVLDWETACIDLFILDIATAVLGLCRVEGLFDPVRAKAFLDGYQLVRPLIDLEQESLCDTIVYASVRVAYLRYVRLNVLWPDPTRQHLYQELPPYVESLRARWTGSLVQ